MRKKRFQYFSKIFYKVFLMVRTILEITILTTNTMMLISNHLGANCQSRTSTWANENGRAMANMKNKNRYGSLMASYQTLNTVNGFLIEKNVAGVTLQRWL